MLNHNIKQNKAFTLLEVILVIAIIAVLAGLVIFLIRPSELLFNTKNSRREADKFSIQEGLNAYISRESEIPPELLGLETGRYDICRYGNENCTGTSVSLDLLVDTKYLKKIPIDPDCTSETDSCYDLAYSSKYNEYVIISANDDVPFELPLPEINIPSTLSEASGHLLVAGINHNDSLGSSVGGKGDVNNDGYDDFIIGAYGTDGEGTNRGKAHLVYGRASVVDPLINAQQTDVTFNGENDSDLFGYKVKILEDINGDSYDDIMISAYQANAGGTTRGKVYIFFGANNLPGSIEAANADIIISGVANGDQIGYSMASGNINNDNYNDFIISSRYADAPSKTDSGRVYVFFGGSDLNSVSSLLSSDADYVIDGEKAYDHFGINIDSGFDYNNDGYEDILVGADNAEEPGCVGGCNQGRVYVMLGGPTLTGTTSATTAAVILDAVDVATNLGQYVAALGDINGDGYGDIMAGTIRHQVSGQTNVGGAFILYGNGETSTQRKTIITSADVTINGVNSSEYFGYYLGGIGDINNDGFDDFGIARFASSYLYIYLGSETLPSTLSRTDANLILSGSGPNFGIEPTSVGDYNNDGYNDLILGIPYGFNEAGSVTAGRAMLYMPALDT